MKYEVLEGAGEFPNRHHFLFCVLLLVFSVSLSVLGSQFRSSPRFLLVRPVVQSRTDETDYCDLWHALTIRVTLELLRRPGIRSMRSRLKIHQLCGINRIMT